MKLPPPTQSNEKHNAFFEILLKKYCRKRRVFGIAEKGGFLDWVCQTSSL
jgi:hypothetical protein